MKDHAKQTEEVRDYIEKLLRPIGPEQLKSLFITLLARHVHQQMGAHLVHVTREEIDGLSNFMSDLALEALANIERALKEKRASRANHQAQTVPGKADPQGVQPDAEVPEHQKPLH